MVGYRNRAMAEKAWHCQKHLFGKRQYRNEFKAGFVAGYLDIANGGAGCCPTIAPPAYWGWRYQSAQGQAAVNAWFEGFPLGVRAAEQDGVGSWQQIRTYTPGVPVAGQLSPMSPEQVPVPEPVYPDSGMSPGSFPDEPVEMNLDGARLSVPPVEADTARNGNEEQFNGFPISELGGDRGEVQFQLNSEQNDLLSPVRVAQRPDSIGNAIGGPAMPVAPGQPSSLEFTAPLQANDEAVVDELNGEDTEELPFSFE